MSTREKMIWNQPICLSCWLAKNPHRGPLCVVEPDEETCCQCGEATSDGIYIRIDPRTIAFPKGDDSPNAAGGDAK